GGVGGAGGGREAPAPAPPQGNARPAPRGASGRRKQTPAANGALWTFASVEGVEPTNNAAEQALRHAVCWRKTSYGTDSEAGSRFVERVLTVVASCRQQGRDVLAFLTDAIQAARAGTQPPSLIPVHASTP